MRLVDFTFTPETFPVGGQTTVSVTLAADRELSVPHLCVLIYSQMETRVAIIDLRSVDGPYRLPSGGQLSATLPRVTLV